MFINVKYLEQCSKHWMLNAIVILGVVDVNFIIVTPHDAMTSAGQELLRTKEAKLFLQIHEIV